MMGLIETMANEQHTLSETFENMPKSRPIKKNVKSTVRPGVKNRSEEQDKLEAIVRR